MKRFALLLLALSLSRPVAAAEYDLIIGPAFGTDALVVELQPPAVASLKCHCYVVVNKLWRGSGTLCYDNGRYGGILTAAHLFEEDTKPVVVTFPGRGDFDATLVALDKRNDVAVLAISSPGLQPAELATRFAGGDYVACGFGGDSIFRTMRGRYQRRSGRHTWIVIDGEVRPGDSGGGVFDREGRLAGSIWGVHKGDHETYFTSTVDLRGF